MDGPAQRGPMVLGVPLHLVKAYSNTRAQMTNAMRGRESARREADTVKTTLLDVSLRILTGRIEGIGLAYLYWCEDNEPETVDADLVNERIEAAYVQWASDGPTD